MSTPVKAILIAVLVVAAGGGGYWFGHRSTNPNPGAAADPSAKADPAAPEEDKPPVASVATVPARRATMSGKVAAFGSVIAQPGEVRVVSAPYESRVGHMLVTAGQQVSADAELVGVDPSPDTATQLQDARNTVAAAGRDLARPSSGSTTDSPRTRNSPPASKTSPPRSSSSTAWKNAGRARRRS